MNSIDVVSSNGELISQLASAMDIFHNIYVDAVTQQQAKNDYQAGSGLTTNKLATAAKAIAISFALIMAVWAIICELRAWGADGGDSADLGSTIIRGCLLFAFIGLVVSMII